MNLNIGFSEWFNVNHEANLRYILFLKEHPGLPSKIYEILVHIVLAHKIWNGRLLVKPQIVNPWGARNIDSLETENNRNTDETITLIKRVDPMDMISYTNSKGDSFKSSVSDILIHLLLHSSYHRGQLAILLRSENIDPPVTDYISFKR